MITISSFRTLTFNAGDFKLFFLKKYILDEEIVLNYILSKAVSEILIP